MEPVSKKRKLKNNELTIKNKLSLIDDSEKKGLSERALAAQYNISKSQVHRILANKEAIKSKKTTRKSLKRSRLNRKFLI